MRVLLVDDDRLLASAIRAGLAQVGHAVDWVQRGADMPGALDQARYGVVLLDLGLPDVPGSKLLEDLRERGSPCPVIVITSRSQVRDRVELLDKGADDYVVKPLDLDELAARIRAVTRRSDATEPILLRFEHGPLRLFPATRTATWHGEPVQLNNKEFDVLMAMLRLKSRRPLLSRSEIEDALYGWGDEVDSNVVQVHIHHLRRKLCPDFIETVRGQGYRLQPEV